MRRHNAVAVPHKMGAERVTLIEEKLTESQWSLQQISRWMAKTSGVSASPNDLGADFYFAKPYHSWERGLNEHMNGSVRQYIPKNTSTPPSAEELDRIETLLNNRPGKVLSFNSPQEVFSEALPRPPPNRALHW